MTPEEKVIRAREAGRRWKKNNRDKVRAQKRRWREKHREKFLAQHRAQQARWVAANPDYVREYAALSYARRARKVKRAVGERIFAAAAAAVPHTLPAHVRDEVVATLALGVIERRFTVGDLATQAKRELTAYYRLFDQHKTLSLDATLPGTDLRRVDTVTAADQCWGAA